MKKGVFVLISLALLLSVGFISACQLSPQLISQDPYPAVPGDYVKLVFQVTGIQDPTCGNITFQLDPQYPISFDPGVSSTFSLLGGSYATNYNNYITIPYNVRIDPNAIDGNSTLEFDYRANGASSPVANFFNLSVQNVGSSFQVFVKNFDYSTNDITFEVLNIGKNDVDSLTVTIPPGQNNVTVSGPNTNVIGSLSSNDFTTADFTMLPKKANIQMTLSYNDITGTMRSFNTTVYFDPTQFPKPAQSHVAFFIIIILIILVVIYIIYRRRKKNKKKKLLRE